MKNVAPNSVSGRVVKTVTSVAGTSDAAASRAAPAPARRSPGPPIRRLAARLNTTSAPVDLPIQLRCMVMTRSGQDSSLSKSSSRRSA